MCVCVCVVVVGVCVGVEVRFRDSQLRPRAFEQSPAARSSQGLLLAAVLLMRGPENTAETGDVSAHPTRDAPAHRSLHRAT